MYGHDQVKAGHGFHGCAWTACPLNPSKLFQHALGLAALLLLAGCASVTPVQRTAGERALQQMADAFKAPVHDPFFLPGGSNAVLLVHGVPGSPAQMRPLAEALHAQGWTVRGLLIPGNGRDTGRITRMTGVEWTNAIRSAVAEMAPHYARLLVVGYSMGAAMTCASLTPGDVDGLVLIAPYQWQESWTDRLVWTCLRPFMPHWYQPFRKSDLSDPANRARLVEYFPREFLNRPDAQEAIRSITFSLPLIASLRATVRPAYGRAWEGGRVPVLILQGAADPVAHAARSRELARRWDGLTRYEELAGDHLLLEPTSPALPVIVRRLCAFAAETAAAPPRRTPVPAGSRDPR